MTTNTEAITMAMTAAAVREIANGESAAPVAMIMAVASGRP